MLIGSSEFFVVDPEGKFHCPDTALLRSFAEIVDANRTPLGMRYDDDVLTVGTQLYYALPVKISLIESRAVLITRYGRDEASPERFSPQVIEHFTRIRRAADLGDEVRGAGFSGAYFLVPGADGSSSAVEIPKRGQRGRCPDMTITRFLRHLREEEGMTAAADVQFRELFLPRVREVSERLAQQRIAGPDETAFQCLSREGSPAAKAPARAATVKA